MLCVARGAPLWYFKYRLHWKCSELYILHFHKSKYIFNVNCELQYLAYLLGSL